MRASLIGVSVFFSFAACQRPCVASDVDIMAVCRAADAGAVPAGEGFTLFAEAQWYSEATCRVSVDGGAVTLTLEGTPSGCSSVPAGGAPTPPPPRYFPCELPAFDGGSWEVLLPTGTVRFGGDAGAPSACP